MVRLLSVLAASILFAAAVPAEEVAPPPGSLWIKLRDPLTVRAVYEELGFVFDDAETEARRDEFTGRCAAQGSARFGASPQSILYVGMAHHTDDPRRRLSPICVGLHPYHLMEAQELCMVLKRPLVRNLPRELEIVCGPRWG